MNEKSWRLRRLTVLALFAALSFVAVALIRIPVVLWLSYEPKDVLITIGAFLFGPLSGAAMAVVVALIELVTISSTGLIGLVMNILSSCLFVCTASIIYHRKKTLTNALLGLVCGAVVMAAGMVLWNYLITPLYMENTTREQVAGMLLPVFLPFNLFKGGLNAALTLLLYKGVSSSLRAAHLLPKAESATPIKRHLPVTVLALVLIAALSLTLLVWRGII